MAPKKTTTKGRPSGRKNNQVDHAEGQLTRCPKCGSTDRTPYTLRLVQRHEGFDPAGKPYTAIVRRRTSCAACGQHRIDRHYEFKRAKK